MSISGLVVKKLFPLWVRVLGSDVSSAFDGEEGRLVWTLLANNILNCWPLRRAAFL